MCVVELLPAAERRAAVRAASPWPGPEDVASLVEGSWGGYEALTGDGCHMQRICVFCLGGECVYA